MHIEPSRKTALVTGSFDGFMIVSAALQQASATTGRGAACPLAG